MTEDKSIQKSQSSDPKDSWLWKCLEYLGKVSGIGTIIFTIGRLINVSTIYTDLFVIFSVIVLIIALLGSQFFRRLIKEGLPVICIILAGLLAWIVFSHKEDSWRTWEKNVSAAVNDCKVKYKDKSDLCIATALTDQGIPTPASDLPSEQLVNDLRAGTFYFQEKSVLDMLKIQLGIEKQFLGTGFALPLGAVSYKDAIIPEYLVNNYEENHSAALTWQLNPKEGFQYNTVEEIITGQPAISTNPNEKPKVIPPPINSKEKLKILLPLIQKAFNNPSAPPPVIRFQQFSQKRSEKFGRTEAKRVFFLNLKAVWKMNLVDAIRVSGYIDNNQNLDDPIYIWVFLPTNDNEVVPATWGKIIPRLKSWMNDK